ncbi:MAG: SAM-dependent methyltransferase [Rickettsiales bacterium]|nr:SAM-dependent methyltransferase [Rickettsiales bacterium]|tara:strand:- start:4099 stop:4782 length:684 start_codon:yes stop_codon:yes gene_type:complete
MLKKDQFYKDILDGLSLFYDSRFINDIRNTALNFPMSSLGNALNKRQTASKLWLLDCLHQTQGSNLGSVHILGGWYGVLASLLIHDNRFNIDHITSFDIDPSCAPIAENLNATGIEHGLFSTHSANILDLNYGLERVTINDQEIGNRPDLVINTSCEHLVEFSTWFEALPKDTLLVLQSNDYFSEPEHINCQADLIAFQEQAPMRDLLFAGELNLDKYTRFMLIGRR